MFIETQNIHKIYGSRKVVSGINLKLLQGQVIGLLGPNGAGKTTFFYTVVGLVKATTGKIILNDVDITNLTLDKRAKLGIGYLPQEPSLFKKLSVYNNVAMAFESMGFSRAQIKEKTFELLNKFGLKKLANDKASTLSGGERRRCEICRCLAIDPKFILLDEPFAGVDPIAVADIKKFILNLKSNNIGVLITDHNVRETLEICDYGYLMKEGEVFFSGIPSEITNNELVKKYYLGSEFKI